jgi:hypothetical protein
LKSRDLSHVKDIFDKNPLLAYVQANELIDRKIAQRMGHRGGDYGMYVNEKYQNQG